MNNSGFRFNIQIKENNTKKTEHKILTVPAPFSDIKPLSSNRICNGFKKNWTRDVADKIKSPTLSKLLFLIRNFTAAIKYIVKQIF